MNTHARIQSIVYKPEGIDPIPADHYARVALESAELIARHGIAGDKKGGHPKRQLNIMDAETLAELAQEGYKIAPGQMGEQIVLADLDVNSLSSGSRLQLGESAIIEVVEPRNGCARFEHIQGQPKSATAGRLGIIAVVVTDGPIKVGDRVRIVVQA